MNHKEKAVRLVLAVMVCVLAAGIMGYLKGPLARIVSYPKAAAMLIYLETGRVLKPAQPIETVQDMETTEAWQPTKPADVGISFDKEDADLVQVSNFCPYTVDIPALLMTDLRWDLTQAQPKVLILHSHATESYTQTAEYSYTPSSAYRTLDTQCNMVRVGQALQQALEAKGIAVIHDPTLHDHPSYNDAYINSRKTAGAWLKQHPSISLVIDLHRDASDTSAGQLDTLAVVDGKDAAQLMLVVGSNAGGRNHPHWEENMALAAKLHAQLEKRFPGICRPISFRTERFNQDLSAGALLIEVGTAGDTLEEALVAAEALAEGIADLALGTATAGSTS